ncbi:MAG: hypothetical protein DWG80_04045 [Chloroflexi bacterium]|nr:hypothetical protein [Chloroflexota bacterium]MQC18233.1 hypothetical protein [Chloroflexota bacterium]
MTEDAFAPPVDLPDHALPDYALPDYALRPDPLDPPEWLLLVVRRIEDGSYLLARRPESPVLSMLSTAPPHRDEGFEAGIASLLWARLGLGVAGRPVRSEHAHPARMGHPYTGGPSMGLLRAVAVEVTGEPAPDALVESLEMLDDEEAWAALTTDLERAVFRDGVELLG